MIAFWFVGVEYDSPEYLTKSAIAQLPNVTAIQRSGTLGMYEEFANEVVQELKKFI